MRRSVWFFLLLLVGLNGYVYIRQRMLSLFIAVLILNIAAGAWFLSNIFFPPKANGRPNPNAERGVVMLFVLLNGIVFLGAYDSMMIRNHPVVEIAEAMPPFEWTGFDGASHKSAELAGHTAVLHYWATWCNPCRKEFPLLVSFARAHPDITFLAFDASDERAKADEFIAKVEKDASAKIPANLMLVWDPDGKVVNDIFRIQVFPSSIVVDPRGVMRRRLGMPVEWDKPEMDGYLKRLSGGR